MVEAIMKKQRQQNKGTNGETVVPMTRGYERELVRVNPGVRGVAVTAPGSHPAGQGGNLIDQWRQARLCFKCGDRYHPRHQCKRHLLLLEGEEEAVEKEEEIIEEELEEEDSGEISLHALKGLTNNKIIKVEGRVPEAV